MNRVSKRLSVLVICALLLGCDAQQFESSHHEPAITVVDFSGQTIRLEKPATKIIALAPHIVENVYSAGAGDQLVGVAQHSDFPAAAKLLPIVSGYAKTNFEKIIELEPDLVIAWKSGNSLASIERIKQLGFTVYVDQPDTLEDIAKSIRDIGVLSGHVQSAEQTAATFMGVVEKRRRQYANKARISTFYQVWNKPLQTINGKHFISAAIELCGGVNIYASEPMIAPIINIESILDRDPDVIIASGVSNTRPEWLDEWRQWPTLSAVQNENLYFIPPDYIQRHSVRLLSGIDQVCEQLEVARLKHKGG